MLNRLKQNLSSSNYYLKEFLIIASLYLFISIFITGFSFLNILTNLLLIGSILFVALYLLGRKRYKELNNIGSIVRSIRKNKVNSASQIELGRHLGGLEKEIQAMFLRTQNDINNLTKLELARTEFLGNVSHELRTPIFTIQGYLETLLNGAIDDPKVNKNFLKKALNHTENLNHLLNDLIDISMIESGQMRMSFRYFKIADLLSDVINEFKPIAERQNLSLELTINKPNLRLFGDKERLKQVFSNLLSNSIKYTQKGGIEIVVNEKKKFGIITIKDTGYGIPEDDINRVFERFYRTNRERSEGISGTGLGLAIVKHIVEAHNSKVELKSKLGIGSEFSFKLKR